MLDYLKRLDHGDRGVVSDDPIEKYRRAFERDGDRYVPTPLTRGPWDPRAMHGGAPSALFAHVCELHDPGPAGFVARVTVELLAPGSARAADDARAHDPARQESAVARSRAARRRRPRDDAPRRCCDCAAPTSTRVARSASSPTPASARRGQRARRASSARVTWATGTRTPDRGSCVGDWTEPGPAGLDPLRCPVVAGEVLSPCSRAAAAADFGSGVGNPLRFTHASAINADVTVALHRHPAGEWVCLESGAWANPHGVGLAETRLHDGAAVGRAVQTLLVEPIAQTRQPAQIRRPGRLTKVAGVGRPEVAAASNATRRQNLG